MADEFKACLAPQDPQNSQAWWFIFSGYRLLVRAKESMTEVPLTESPEKLGIMAVCRIHAGIIGNVSCYAAETDFTGEVPAGFVFVELRSLFGRLEDAFYQAALTAIHLVEWERNCLWCSKCRGELKACADVRSKKCEQCGRLEFPRVSPAIIVAIERENTLLLARSARFPLPFFSVLAGFVEPGENLEAAVRREVMEESGISVKNVRYFGSQPWPFPDSLMIGFTAEYESGEIRTDGQEIVEAGWFRADNLPQIPGKLSIARQLIDWFVAKQKSG